jgi:trehalose 6-phosphate phosphatase
VALFLDLDGTIAEIAARPGDVGPSARRSGILNALSNALSQRVAVLTGRTLKEADRILDGSVTPVAAVHGLVRRMPGGGVVQFLPSPELSHAKQSLTDLAQTDSGLLIEDKGASVALHYRQAPASERAARMTVQQISRATGLVVQEGAMVSELRTPGPHKGDSLKAFLSEPPFAGYMPVMVGDDLTDEHAFAAAAEAGGYGILVGPARSTCARYGLGSVAEVLAWLDVGAGR